MSAPSQLLLIGVNHKVTPVEIRERLAWNADRCPQALAELVERLSKATVEPPPEVVLLSTCNRTEIYAITGNRCQAEASLKDFLAERARLTRNSLDEMAYVACEQEAAQHLMQVATGLDSLVKGENEILGQIKAAAMIAHQARTSGPVLSALFRFAIQAGKQVRSQTEIGRTGHSVASVVVELAEEQLGLLEHRTALLVGAGKISAMAARELVKAGLRCVLVANRTYERAQKLARNLGEGRAAAVHFDALPESLVEADLVICSTGAPHTVLHTAMVKQALDRRPHRPLLVADLAVPRDADPEIGLLAGVTLTDIDDLERLTQTRHPLTADCLDAAQEICRQSAAEFQHWLETRQRVPVIQALRSKANLICEQEVDHTLRRMSADLSDEQQQAIRLMAQAIVNKLLHEPINAIKDPPDDISSEAYLDWVRSFYGLKATDRLT